MDAEASSILAATSASKEGHGQSTAKAGTGALSAAPDLVTEQNQQQANARADGEHAVTLAELPVEILSQLQSKGEADRLNMSPSVAASPSMADQDGSQLLDQDFDARSGTQPRQEDSATMQKQAQAADNKHSSVWGALLQHCCCCWKGLGRQSVTWHIMMVLVFGVQLAMAAYFGLVHQR